MPLTELRVEVAPADFKDWGPLLALFQDSFAYNVGKLAVAELARGLGLARQLLAVAESIARAAGRPVLELQTRVELVENHQAFAAMGFTKVAESAHAGYARPTSITLQRPVQGLSLL